MHVALTGERQGYYEDYGAPEQFPQLLENTFVLNGCYSAHRGRCHGGPDAGLPGDRFVVSIQNHDQVGNRARGERLTVLVPRGARMLAAALLLLAPETPLLFMGQEYDEPNPFLFFTDYGDPSLQQAVREGRRQEFKDFDFADDQVPDPQDPATFNQSKLDWQLTQGENQMLDWYKSLLALRQKYVIHSERTCKAEFSNGIIHMQLPAEEPTLKVFARIQSAAALPELGAGWERALAEEEERVVKDRRYSELKEGDTVHGTVRSLASYGAFIDIGGVDALLHVSDISWSRINQPADVLVAGQEIEGKVLKIDSEKRRISIGMKQLQPHPWDAVGQKFTTGQRVRGTVTRVVEFGAFVELEPGIEGLIHVTEMSWAKKVRIASDVVKPGETVDAVILAVNLAERRISLGLKQALGDPWADVTKNLTVGSVVEGPVTNLTKFGAFVQVAEGVEGMVHISDLSAEKRINHPSDVLRVGQVVKAQLLTIDTDKRQLRLGMKQLVPTGLDEYIAEHKAGDTVTGRMLDSSEDGGRVELGEGVIAICRASAGTAAAKSESVSSPSLDMASLSAMLNARWKSGPASGAAKKESIRAGQVRSFRVTKLDPASKKIEVEPA